MVKEVIIFNFKSIKRAYFKTKRINLFIGYPNVGKSNVLEALSLLSSYQSSYKFMNGYVRYDDLENLFYENDSSLGLAVATNISLAYLKPGTSLSNKFEYSLQTGKISLEILNKFLNDETKEVAFFHRVKRILKNNENTTESYEYNLDGSPTMGSTDGDYDFLFSNDSDQREIKKFDFKASDTFKNRFAEYLLPPYGENLFTILENNEELYDEVNNLLASNGLELVLQTKGRKLEVQRKKGKKTYAFPYTSIADTVQRLAFYFAAIYSNKDSVLLFEEPEAHSFPPYVQMLASRIAADPSNQYFITTHSPYIFDTLTERLGKNDIAVHICSFQDDQTHIRTLSEKELTNVQNMREEIFFNLEKYS